MVYFELPGDNSIKRRLANPKSNIDAAGKLLKKYLDELCEAAKGGKVASFNKYFAPGCKISDFCCATEKKDCAAVADSVAPRCLMSAMTAIWNADIGIIYKEGDFRGDIPETTKHSDLGWAIYDYIEDLLLAQ